MSRAEIRPDKTPESPCVGGREGADRIRTGVCDVTNENLYVDRTGLIPVRIQAADGPAVVWHTPEEYAAFMRGVEVEAALILTEELEV